MDEAQGYITTLITGLLGIVAITAAIAIMYVIVRWFIHPEEHETPLPIIEKFSSTTMFVLAIAALAGGGTLLTSRILINSDVYGYSAAGKNDPWMPPSSVTGENTRTIAEVINTSAKGKQAAQKSINSAVNHANQAQQQFAAGNYGQALQESAFASRDLIKGFAEYHNGKNKGVTGVIKSAALGPIGVVRDVASYTVQVNKAAKSKDDAPKNSFTKKARSIAQAAAILSDR